MRHLYHGKLLNDQIGFVNHQSVFAADLSDFRLQFHHFCSIKPLII